MNSHVKRHAMRLTHSGQLSSRPGPPAGVRVPPCVPRCQMLRSTVHMPDEASY